MSGRTSTARAVSNRRQRLSSQIHAQAFWQWLRAGSIWIFKRSIGFTLGFTALGLAILGVFRKADAGSTHQLLTLVGLSSVLLVRLFERLQRPKTSHKDRSWADLELGTLFIAASFVLIELTGGPSGLLYPITYALVAFLVRFHTLPQTVYFLALILGVEGATLLLQTEASGVKLFVSHASFILLFGFLYAMFLRGENVRARKYVAREVESHLSSIGEAARDFRLTSGLSSEGRELSANDLRARRQIGSIQAIQESLYNVLAVAERALSPFTVALLWLDTDDKRLKVKELRSQSDHIVESAFSAGEGILGAITKRREPLVLQDLKPGYAGLSYYRKPERVTDFAGVPVLAGEHLRGVLVADRTNNQSFTQSDLSVMKTIAQEIVRAVQVERIFAEMDTDKYQRERFYEASREFNSALTVDQVASVLLQASQRVASPEFAAVAVADDVEGEMTVVRAKSTRADTPDITGYTFQAEKGLIGAAVKAKHPLPFGTARSSMQAVFDGQSEIDLSNVKVFPLLWKSTGVGALVLASDRNDFLPLDLLDMLRVIADHAAIAIANAQMYERMKRMATTDGLTSLTNHRHFQKFFDGHLARAERYGRKLSLIMLDIDHFKTINDTYGHPAGDMVLRRVAKLLNDNARKTDVVARYGGEEFTILMEETDREGAVQIAERIRCAVEEESFRCELGKFSCTLSLGVATYPEDAQNKSGLTECADQALYHGKHHGRKPYCCLQPNSKKDGVMTDERKTFVLDTNVLLHDPKAMFSFDEHDVVIPIYVIEEVDNFKKDLSELGRNARQVTRYLDELRLEGKLSEGVPTSGGGVIRVAFTATELPEEYRSQRNTDNRIMATAMDCHKQDTDRATTFVTKDANLRIRSDALGLHVEDFDSERTDISELYSGVAELEVSGEKIDAFYKEGKLALDDPYYFPNQFAFLKDTANASHTALGKINMDDQCVLPLHHPQERHVGNPLPQSRAKLCRGYSPQRRYQIGHPGRQSRHRQNPDGHRRGTSESYGGKCLPTALDLSPNLSPRTRHRLSARRH